MADDVKNERFLTRDQVETYIRDAHAEAKQIGRRWQLIVGVGNGAGFTAVGARITEVLSGPVTAQSKAIIALLFPSAILFGMGLIVVGVSTLLNVARAEATLSALHSVRYAMIDGDLHEAWPEPFSPKEFIDRWFLELISAIAFVAGIAAPLLQLSLVFIRDGHFS
ncbi:MULTISPECIES: hypothetical protein [unclassified Brevundimonas]|uniref:hypothetical protein n=1 Tax=unclassified Brevundimonas TaxID=2622653 RepID=UPI0025BC66BD|nr:MULTISPECIES: hypothetical protein [unclassified Brevundimonas]